MAASITSLNIWNRMLGDCLNGNQASSYLYTDERTIKMVGANDPCPLGFRKMPLREIFLNSLIFFRFPDEDGSFQKFRHDKWIAMKLRNAISCHDLFDNDNTFDELIQNIQALSSTCDSICESLSTMIRRGQMKRTSQKISSLYEFFLCYFLNPIKYLIWNQFYSPSSELKILYQYRDNIKTAIPITFQQVPQILKDRAHINIDNFLEIIGKQETIEIQASKDINFRFLSKYHPDKYPLDSIVSEEKRKDATTYVNRIIIIKDTWQQFEKRLQMI